MLGELNGNYWSTSTFIMVRKKLVVRCVVMGAVFVVKGDVVDVESGVVRRGRWR